MSYHARANELFPLVSFYAAVISILMIVGGVLAVAFRVVFESNHVGHGLWDYWPYWVAWVAVGVLNLAAGRRNRRIAVLLLLLCLVTPLGVYLLDRLALLVPYEEWIRRGMPAKPWLR